jgi:hypothetical protein
MLGEANSQEMASSTIRKPIKFLVRTDDSSLCTDPSRPVHGEESSDLEFRLALSMGWRSARCLTSRSTG